MVKTYDGNAYGVEAEASLEGATVKYWNEETQAYDLDESPIFTNWTDGAQTVKFQATLYGYKTAEGEATVTINKTITTNDASKVYDGSMLTNETYEVTPGSFVDGETYGVDFGESGQLTVGQSENNATVIFAGEGNEYTAQADNYNVTVDPGILTVYPQSIDPTDPDPNNPDPEDPNYPDPDDPDTDPDQPYYTGAEVQWPGNVVYNGSSQQQKVVVTDAQGKTLEEGTHYTLSYSEDTTNVGTVTVTVTAIEGSGYAGSVSGTYQITPAPLTISTPSASKVYDGTALTAGPADVEGRQGDDVITATATGSRTEVGQSINTVDVTWNGLLGNYSVTYDLGTLTVFPQSIDPTDPDPDNPEPGDPDPTDPDPENPDQPFYTGVSVDYPTDQPYNGTDQTWTPTVTDADGNVLVANRDYTVSYDKADRTNVTGAINVTITGIGNYAGTITRTYQITPLTITVTPDEITKYAGQADPALTSGYSGYLEGEVAGWTGSLTREPGEAVGDYAITQGDLALADNPETGFVASNYTLVVVDGVFHIVAAPATPVTPTTPPAGDGGTGTTPTGPAAPVPTTPAVLAPVDDDAADAADDEGIEDDETPLAGRDEEESIEDDANPLASGNAHVDCWVHWLILVGMILTAVYFVGVAVRRRKFTSDLLGYEDKVLGNNRDNA